MKLLAPTFLLLLFQLLDSSTGEVELICPPILSGTEYTELTSGPRTIIFRETNARQGSPFRLSIYRNSQECIVLDHIPYQSLTNNMYYLTVDIPDVTCTRAQNCRMVLRQIDTTANGYCVYSSCPQYNSTTQISVRGSSGNSFVCPGRSTPMSVYNWPNSPSRQYTASLTSTSSSARATGTFVLVGDTLLYNVSMTVPFSTPTRAERLRFFYYPVAERAEILSVINIDGADSWHAGSWNGLTNDTVQIFTNGQLFVDIVTSTNTNGDIIGGIAPTNNANPRNDLYGSEYGNYNSNGWLTGSPFTGPQASATLFGYPVGPCINTTRSFGCMLMTSIANGGGTAALAVTGTRLVFGVDMFNVSSRINSVNLVGTATETLQLTSFWSDGYRISGIIDISSEQQTRLTSGLSSIEISTGNGGLSCNLEEGIIAFMGSGVEKPPVTTPTNGSGTAFISFSVSSNVTIQVTLNNLTTPLEKGHLHGPAYQGIPTGSIPLDMSNYIEGMNGSSWNVRATFRNISAAEFRYFIEGLYYLNMHTTANPAGELRGQLSIPGQWMCPSTDLQTNQCKFVRLATVDGVQVNTTLQPAGIGAVVIGRTQRLQFSLAFWNIPSSMTLQIMLTSPDGVITTVTDTQMSTNRANVQEINTFYPTAYDQELDQSILQYAEQGRLAFNVTTPTNPSGYLYGTIPPLQANKCRQEPYTIIIGGNDGWSQGQPYVPIRVLQNDILNFTFSSPDSVYLMDNRNRYDGCVFAATTATLLSDTPGTFPYMTNNTGNLYFASRSACQGNPPMKFPAYVVAGIPGELDDSACSQSLYSFTAEQRYVSAGSQGTIVASAIAAVIGTVMVVAVIVIMVILVVRRRITGDSADVSKPPKA